MGPNDANIVRVFTRVVDGPVAESAFPSDTDFEVVVEVEAGSAIFSLGGQYTVELVIVDYGSFNLFATPAPKPPGAPTAPAVAAADHMKTGKWTNQSQQFVYTVSKTDLTTREGHFCEVLASLSVGVTTPDMSFARSGLFIITKP